MNQPVRWGILGAGKIAKTFTKDILATGHQVSSVGSRDLAKAQAFASEFGLPAAHGSYDELVNDPDVDIVYVATPHPMHAENAMLALRAGKHVLVEKPFTLNAPEAKAVVDLAREQGLLVLEAMWTRWLPHMVRIREIIASGVLGEVRSIIVDHTQKLSADPSNRINAPELGGGALLDLGVYPISFAWDVFGAPEQVIAMSSPAETGVDQATAVLLTYSGGRTAITFSAANTRGPNRAAIIGTEARIEIDPVWYFVTGFSVIAADGTVLEHFDQPHQTRGMEHQADEAERLIRASLTESDVLPAAETIAIMGTMDKVRRHIGLRYPGE